MTVVFETDRFVVRRFIEGDAKDLLQMEIEPDVLRYVGRKPLPDVDAYQRKIQTVYLPLYKPPGGLGAWAVNQKSTNEFVGSCSLRRITDEDAAAEMNYEPGDLEFGYMLCRQFWGRGYATEIARALVHRAFVKFSANRVVACVTVDNLASIRVLEKVGLTRCSEPICLPGEDELTVKYSLTKNRFEA
jgi:RimJ/RimL family protein N-acetyltransferase